MGRDRGSRWADLGGAQVHWADLGGPVDPAAVLVLVHGLGGSTANWEGLPPSLADAYRLVALDLVGFGMTRPGERGADVAANAELLGAFVDQVVGPLARGAPVVLVGNSMGALICVAWLAGRTAAAFEGEPPPVTDVAGLVLVAPALPPAGPVPGPYLLGGLLLYGTTAAGRVLARGRRRWRTPEQSVADTLRLCLGDPSRISPELRARHLELARHRIERVDLDAPFAEAARSTVLASVARTRVADLYDQVDVPVLLVHGTRDRLVPYPAALAMARRHPGWRLESGRGLGHVPQIEDPAWTGAVVRRWLDGVPTVRSRASSPGRDRDGVVG